MMMDDGRGVPSETATEATIGSDSNKGGVLFRIVPRRPGTRMSFRRALWSNETRRLCQSVTSVFSRVSHQSQ
jgi:hypothetical protein